MTLRSFILLSTVLLLIFSTVLHAQIADDQRSEGTAPTEEAQEEPQATITEEVTVTATRLEVAVDTVGSSVTILGSQEIEKHKKTSALELLRTAPGLEITQTGGPGKITSAFLRGAGSAHTLVLIDGTRANSVNSGGFDLSNIRADNIERIEVVRGPQSTLYGSEAIGGVINIITRRGEPGFQSALGLEVGSHEFFSSRLSLRGGNELARYSTTLAYESTEGVSAASENAGNTEKDGYENFTASGRFDFDFLDDGEIDLTLRYVDSETSLDGFTFGVGPTDDLNFVSARESLFASLKINKPLTDWWSQHFTFSLSDGELRGEDPDTIFNNFTIDERISEFTFLANLTPIDRNILTLGYSIERREGKSEGNFEESIYLRSAFLQNQWSWKDRLFLTVGVRNDDHSEFGGETTFRGTLAFFAAGGKMRFHGSYGTGFRAPSLNELFFPFFGNPDLRPESSEGFDLGVEQRFYNGRVTFDITYFHNNFNDLIGFDVTTFLANNILNANSEGGEITLRIILSSFVDLNASYTYTSSEDETTGDLLPRRPKNRGTLALGFEPHEKLRGILSLLVVQDRIDSDGTDMDDYERVDLSLGYNITDRLTPYIRVENLLNEDYEEVNGFTSPGFVAAVGLNIDF